MFFCYGSAIYANLGGGEVNVLSRNCWNIVILFLLYKNDRYSKCVSFGNRLWWKCKYTYLFEALVNLILNIILSKLFGVIGIIVATLISVLFINYLCTLVVLCKYYFGRYEFKVYLIKELKCLVSTVIIGVVLWILLTNLNITNLYISLGIRIVACFTIAPCLYLLIYHKSPKAVESVHWLLPNIKKFIKRNN